MNNPDERTAEVAAGKPSRWCGTCANNDKEKGYVSPVCLECVCHCYWQAREDKED